MITIEKRKMAAEAMRAWRIKNPERDKLNAANFRNNNRQKCRDACKKYKDRKFSENPRFYADTHAAWVAKNPDSNRVIMKRWKIKRYHSDPSFRIRQVLCSRLNGAINRQRKGLRKTSITELVGIDLDRLKLHLESKFKDGMSWDNYGQHGWHIDHIVPCDSFDLSDHENQKKCFHYTNLQPLWAIENLRKGATCR